MSGYFKWGDPVPENDLSINRSREILKAAQKNPFYNVIGVVKKGDWEGVIVEVDVELPQRPLVSVLEHERIIIVIKDDESLPEVRALRKSFPDTLHQNLTALGEPKHLCLFEEPFEEIRPYLSAEQFIKRIAGWLSRAAIEELHLEDQPLEPLLLDQIPVAFDKGLFLDKVPDDEIIVITNVSEKSQLPYALSIPKNKLGGENKILNIALRVSAKPWHSRSIFHKPENLKQLSEMMHDLKIDLVGELQNFIEGLQKDNKGFKNIGDKQIAILLNLPKTRIDGGVIEHHEQWVFVIVRKIEDLAINLGLAGKQNGDLGLLIGEREISGLSEVMVFPIKPTFTLTRKLAQEISDTVSDLVKFGVIGVGALGSQIVMSLARQGLGEWSIFDHDILLHHNLARHALSPIYAGWYKAEAIENEIRYLLSEEKAATGYRINFLNIAKIPESKKESECLEEADIILDFSASSAVSRKLAFEDYPGARLSSYLVPSGEYLILIYEGRNRRVRLDDLEKQLFAYVAETPSLSTIFRDEIKRIEYAGSCRDTSLVLPNDQFTYFSSIVVKFIKNNLYSIVPEIRIFRFGDQYLSLANISVPTFDVSIIKVGDWEIRTSRQALDLMHFHRYQQLPNETGGVLLGQIDFDHSVVYISSILSSPPDSSEWPNAYIRGVNGLADEVESIGKITGGAISYIGEWHSHPSGAGVKASIDDKKAHSWLKSEMGSEGLPGIIAIIGERDLPNYLIG